jgi:hypothetical protein
MTLTIGTGLFGDRSTGTFNFDVRAPRDHALYLEESPKRVRVVLGGESVADSRRAKLLHEAGLLPVYYFQKEDVRMEFLEESDHTTHCPFKGDVSYWSAGPLEDAFHQFEYARVLMKGSQYVRLGLIQVASHCDLEPERDDWPFRGPQTGFVSRVLGRQRLLGRDDDEPLAGEQCLASAQLLRDASRGEVAPVDLVPRAIQQQPFFLHLGPSQHGHGRLQHNKFGSYPLRFSQ